MLSIKLHNLGILQPLLLVLLLIVAVLLILLSGRRYELGAGAKAVVKADVLAGTSGAVPGSTEMSPESLRTPAAARRLSGAGAGTAAGTTRVTTASGAADGEPRRAPAPATPATAITQITANPMPPRTTSCRKRALAASFAKRRQ